MGSQRRRRAVRARTRQLNPGTLSPAVLPWPTSTDVAAVCDLDAVAAAALAEATADDMFSVLRSMPPRHRQYVLSALGPRSAVTVDRGTAAQLLARLRADPGGASGMLLYDIAIPVRDLLDHVVAPVPWTSMFGRDTVAALDAYADYPEIAARVADIAQQYAPALLRAALASGIAAGGPGAALALALLAGEDATAATAHAALAVRFPALPPISAGPLTEVGPVARFVSLGELPQDAPVTEERLKLLLERIADLPSAEDDTEDEVVATLPDDGFRSPDGYGSAWPEATDWPLVGPGPLDDETVAVGTEQVLDSWDGMVATADDVAERLRGGEVPPARAIQLLSLHATAATVAAGYLSRHLGTDVPATRTALSAGLDRLTTRPDPDADWLGRLVELAGPVELAGCLAEVRVAALAALADPDLPRDPLVALRDLIEVAGAARRGASVDFTALAAAQHLANTAWPHAAALVAAAAHGALALPEEAPAEPAEPSSDPLTVPSVTTGPGAEGRRDHHPDRAAADSGAAAETDAAAESAAPETAAPETAAAGAADVGPEPSVGTGSAPVALGPPEGDTDGGPADPGPRRVAVTGQGQAAPQDGDGSATDLDDLDRLLSAGAAATLAAVSGTRRRLVPAQRTAPVAPAADDVTAGRAGEEGTVDRAHAALTTLLSARRFGLAADLMAVVGASPASVAARRLAAYASAVRTPTGPIAAAIAQLATEVSRDGLGDDREGQLLALAAAARIALLAPSAGPAALLLDLAPCVSDQPALSEATAAFADASRAGIVVLPEAADVVGTLAAAETAAADAARAAARLLDSSGRRPIKYIPANGVYQAWLAGSGPLGKLLALVAANDVSAVPMVRDEVVGLRGRASKAIDTTFATQRHNRSNQIRAGARSSLVARWDEVIELADRWARHAEQMTENAAAMHAGAWQAGPLAKLRHRLAAVRDAVPAELAAQAAGDRADAAAVEAASQLFADAFAVCDGVAPAGEEAPPEFAAHAELLAAPLPLNADSLLPNDGLTPQHVGVLLDLAAADPVPADEAYAFRAERGDHDLTAVLIAGVRAVDPAVAAGLDRQRTADVLATHGEVDDEITALRNRIDTRRLAGALDDHPWAALAARTERLHDLTRRDFGRIRELAAEISADLDVWQQRKIDETIDRIAERAQDSAVVADAAELLTELARRGEIASAEEYLEQALTGGALPDFADDTDHLRQFFPAVPRIATTYPRLLEELHAALSGEPAGAAVDALVGTGVAVAHLSAARREAGRHAIGAWSALAASVRGKKVDVATALRAVLAQAGLEFTDLQLQQAERGQPGRRWLSISGVRGTGQAVTPTLGSDMSTDGATLRVLLVYNAPTPATVIEWLSGEPNHQTVLALWLVGPLSPDDRRAITNAARGRPRPPLLLLDVAALVYLACQSEPRRSTFALTSLPFTAASPYRDTPGDTPPEMFYGRTEELAAVIDLNGPSFVSGGRQLGKSALLRAAERRFRGDGPQHEAVLTSVFTVGGDGDPERLWYALWPLLKGREIVDGPPPAADIAAVVHGAILRWLDADRTRALLVLLDEADAFLDADAAGNRFTHVDWCRRIMLDSGRRAKMVFAGLHRTARFETLPNQPLSHLGRPITVGPLRPQHACDLLARPLAALGFTFADPKALPARILAMANNMPALLQLFGAALVAHLTAQPLPTDGPPQQITQADVDAVFNDAELREAFRDKYVLTLNLDHRYLVIAYSVAEAAHERGIDASLSMVELSEACRMWWPAGFGSCGADVFRGLVTECVDLGVLAIDGGRYRLRTPTVLRLLGTEEEVLETLYTAPERLTVPSASDGGAYRRRLGKATRSPLTERQFGQLFSARRAVVPITGSAVLGIDAVLAAIETAEKEGAARIRTLRHCGSATPEGVRAAVGRAAGDGTLIVVDGRRLSAPALDGTLTAAAEAVRLARPDVTVAVCAGVAGAAAWIARAQRIELARVDSAGMRLLCDEDNLPFRDDEARSRLLVATGGWPTVVARVAASPPTASSGRILADVEQWLAGPGRAELVADAGVGPTQPALAAAFASAATLTASTGEDPRDLAELLALDDDRLTGLAAEAGYGSLHEVVDTLVALGCLVVTEDGRLRPEPVLAAAVREE
ncbi:hypothetical protein ACGFI4_29845 [Micromonospora carbonacea]|uniref:hypothetical protein n=1 Tax=Micromonospora carbonacea TaxID=47853 RepID=UPI0037229654